MAEQLRADERAGAPQSLGTRPILWAGFGGLILLLGFVGLDCVRMLWLLQLRNGEIRHEFVERNRVLRQVRSDLYLSGTHIRDFLLESDSAKTGNYHAKLEAIRRRLDAAVTTYGNLLGTDTVPQLDSFRRDLADYWRLLNRAIRWRGSHQHTHGYPYLRNEVFPRRQTLLDEAAQLAQVNERKLEQGEQRADGLFARFRQRLAIIIALTLSLGVGLAAYCMRRILMLERESDMRYQETARTRVELKELSARLVEVQENERRVISRELHDEVGQALSALLVELGNLSAVMPHDTSDAVRGHVRVIKSLAESSVRSVRDLALLLRPSMLDDLGLVPALQWQARETTKRTGLTVQVAAESVAEDLPEEHRTCIYRVVQESLHNCSRHAGATTVRIMVRQDDYQLSLSIQDDGQGFDVRHRGLGLLGMQERVERLKGIFQLHSEIGLGTLITVSLPLNAAALEATAA